MWRWRWFSGLMVHSSSLQMSFQEDQEIGFMPRQLSSGSEDHSSSDEASSPCYSSGSEPIPPPPTQSPPPPPPLQALIPPPIPFTDPLPPVRFSPEHVPRSRMPFQPHHPIIPPPPPPPRTILSSRSPLHKKHPSRDENEKTLQRFQPTTRLGHSTLTSTKTLRSRPTYLPRQFSQPQPIRQPSPQPSPQLLRPSQLVLQRHHQLHHQHSYQGPLPPSLQEHSPSQCQSQGHAGSSLLSQPPTSHSTLPSHMKTLETTRQEHHTSKQVTSALCGLFVFCLVTWSTNKTSAHTEIENENTKRFTPSVLQPRALSNRGAN